MCSASLISRIRAGRSCRAARYSRSSTVRAADFTPDPAVLGDPAEVRRLVLALAAHLELVPPGR